MERGIPKRSKLFSSIFGKSKKNIPVLDTELVTPPCSFYFEAERILVTLYNLDP